MPDQPCFQPTRRIVFHGLGAIGVAAVLAGCGGGSGDDSADDPTPEAGAALATTSEVPIGGGIILTDEKIVITQPTEGDFKAFTAVCTHARNTVTSVEDGVIGCSFHGSAFSAETGEVENGPATSPLASVAIEVKGDQILAA